MPPRKTPDPGRADLLQGTLDLLILKTLRPGPAHGHTIASAIERTSDDVLLVDHGSLYPALHRLAKRGWIASEWGVSENNRKAKFYRLTRAGAVQLVRERSKWDRFMNAMVRVLDSAPEEQ